MPRYVWSDEKIEKLILLRGVKYGNSSKNTTAQGNYAENVEIWKKIKEELGMNVSIEYLMNKWGYLVKKYNSWKRFKEVKTSIFDESEKNQTEITNTWKFYDMIHSALNNCYNSLDDDITKDEIMVKCGDILVSSSFKAVFECTFCSKKFHEIEKFCKHLKETHLSPINPTKNRNSNQKLIEECELQNEAIIEQKHINFETVLIQNSEIKIENIVYDNEDNENIKSIIKTEKPDEYPVQINDNREELANVKVEYIDSESKIENTIYGHENSELINSNIKYEELDKSISQTSSNYENNFEQKPENVNPNEVTKTLETLRLNQGVKQNLKNYQCRICLSRLSQLRTLKDHLKKFHNISARSEEAKILTKEENALIIVTETEENLKCVFCSEIFIENDCLKEHIIKLHLNSIKHPVSDKKFQIQCDFCCAQFPSQHQVRIHMKMTHRMGKNFAKCNCTNEKHFICKKCVSSFGSKEECDEHEEFCMGKIKIKRFKCKLCSKQFNTSKSYKQHMNTHEGKKPYQCHLCKQSYAAEANLITHIRRHAGDKRYKCNFCDKRFICSTGRKLHERIHSTEKLFQCTQCGKCFISSSALSMHTKKYHTGIRNHKCQECDKSFFETYSLKMHMISHTKLKQFVCKICNGKFARNKSLKEHEKLHLDVKSYLCKICGKTFKQHAGLYSHMKIHNSTTTSKL